MISEWLVANNKNNKMSSDGINNVLSWICLADDLTTELLSKIIEVGA